MSGCTDCTSLIEHLCQTKSWDMGDHTDSERQGSIVALERANTRCLGWQARTDKGSLTDMWQGKHSSMMRIEDRSRRPDPQACQGGAAGHYDAYLDCN